MKIPPRSAVALVLLLFCQFVGAASYLKHRDVTGSQWYTGTTGDAIAVPRTTEQWLQENVEQLAELALPDYGFVLEDEELNQFIYQIANQLLRQWPGKAPKLAIFVLGDRSPLMYGAATTQFREVFINYGVLINAESTDELAAVIAHELAHILLEHDKTLNYRKSMQASLDAAEDAYEIYAEAEALGYDKENKEITLDPEVEQKLKRSAMQKMVAHKLYQGAHATLFSRGNEYDADRLAMDLLVAANYSPMGLKISLERMAHSYELANEITDYFEANSQALLAESTAALEQSLGEGHETATELQSYMEETGSKLKTSLLNFGKKSISKSALQSHPVPEKRVIEITQYLYDNYPRSVRRRRLDTQNNAAISGGQIGQILDHFQAANISLQDLSENDIKSAEALSLQALSSPTAGTAYTRYAAFQIRRYQGDSDKATMNYLRINESELIPRYATIEFAEHLASTGENKQLNDLMAQSESRYGKTDDYYPARIMAAKYEKNSEEVKRLAQECFQLADPDGTVMQKCALFSGVANNKEDGKTGFGKAITGFGNSFFRKD